MAEVPPSPPVLSTLVAEVDAESAEEQNRLAQEVMKLLQETDGVVDVDSYMEAPQTSVTLAVDTEKAALSGINAEHVAATFRLASAGMDAGLLRDESSRTRFAQSFRYVISQRLIPKIGGGRIAVLEVLKTSDRTRDYVLKGEGEGKSLVDAMNMASTDGMMTFDTEIERIFREGMISRENALAYATNPTNLEIRLTLE